MVSNMFSFHIGSLLFCASRLPAFKRKKSIDWWRTDCGKVLRIGRYEFEIVVD